MRKFLILTGIVTLMASGVQASSYLDKSWVVHDPIKNTNGTNSPYSGNNLEPFADLTNADLASAYLYRANLSDANLSDANLSDANLTRANLHDANLSGANLSGALLINVWATYINLSGADLSGANLSDNGTLAWANLTGANLTGANLSGGTSLWEANLTDANLSGADLTDTWMESADLTGAWNLGTTTGAPSYDDQTNFTNAYSGAYGTSPLFNPEAAGWTLTPEPSTALLLTLGLAGLGTQRRRATHR